MKRKLRQTGAPDEANPEDVLRYASGYHAPVLWKAVVEGLITDRAGTYVDGTLGGGGHAAALLDALGPDGRVIGLDQDADALDEAQERLVDAVDAGRFQAVQSNFGDLEAVLQNLGIRHIDGLLLDLGVSSHQIDQPERGFSYMAEGALDMRMDRHAALSARDLVNDWTEGELKHLFFDFGEEPAAGRIARAMVAARPIETTSELAAVIRSVVRSTEAVKTLSRVFQAIRIAVNAELDVLERALTASISCIRPGGRLAVIAYHSLEDRRVKRFMRSGNFEGRIDRDLYGNRLSPWEELTRRPIDASGAEVAVNPRSRSARLRIAARATDNPEAERR